MRRSSSTSHIPIIRNEGKRSRSITRTSGKDVSGSTSKARAGSTDRLMLSGLKRTNSSSNFKKSAATPILVGKKKSTYLTPTLGLPGVKRSTSNLTTPSTSGSRGRSPFKIGSERAVNDKKWVAAQFSKVLRFLQTHSGCAENISTTLKPPTINSFVYVIGLLFKEIDSTVVVVVANYKEVVPEVLKTLHYPGNISNSLLKTVNTMHSWPHVVSIFAWLVDLITILERVDVPVPPNREQDLQYKKIECVTKFIIQRYMRFNKDESCEDLDRVFVEDFGKILNIDDTEIAQLRERVANLLQTKEKHEKSITELKATCDNVRQEIDQLQNQIDDFYAKKEERKEAIRDETEALKQRKQRLVAKIESKKANIARLQGAIKKQPCTINEKKKIIKHIDEMKHTITLKKETIKEQKVIRELCDTKLAEAKKQIKTEVYRLNNGLMKLIFLEPELKILQLKETDFESPAFAKEVKSFHDNFKMFENKFNAEIHHMMELIPQLDNRISAIEQKIAAGKKNITLLNETKNCVLGEIQKCNRNMEMMLKKREEEHEAILQKIKDFRTSEDDVRVAARRLEELTREKNEKAAEFGALQERALTFMSRVHENVMTNLVEMNNVRTKIVEFLGSRLQQIDQSQKDVLEALKNLDDLRE